VIAQNIVHQQGIDNVNAQCIMQAASQMARLAQNFVLEHSFLSSLLGKPSNNEWGKRNGLERETFERTSQSE
jgi:hypothetical protein